MEWIQVVVLSVLQGFTEFLPISSSAHLILVPKIVGWEDQGLIFDIAVHVGTLFAVISYFYQDLKRIFTNFYISLKMNKEYGQSKKFWLIVIGTIPVGLIGITCGDLIEIYLREPIIIAFSTIIFGALLWYADAKGDKNSDDITMKQALIIGIFQAVALIPGTSRSGITITAALLLGINYNKAIRFSFFLSIPLIILAGISTILKIDETVIIQWDVLLVAILVSFISAFICIHLFLKAIQSIGMKPFIIYRFILGIVLLYIFI